MVLFVCIAKPASLFLPEVYQAIMHDWSRLFDCSRGGWEEGVMLRIEMVEGERRMEYRRSRREKEKVRHGKV